MNNWKAFWSGLNIRKSLALLFGILFGVASVSVVIIGLTSPLNVDKDIITIGLTGLSTMTSMCIAYYFGYTNGQNTKIDTEDNK